MLNAVPTLSWWEDLARLALAAGLGGAIGFERELRDREAGFRTHMLVCLGAALFTIVSAYGFSDFLESRDPRITFDPSRIAAQVVTGIGFLGAGAIIRQGVSIRGLTTAATLWVAAAIGIAAGAGFYSAAILATGVVLIALWPLRRAAHEAVELIRPEEKRVVVVLRPDARTAELLDALEREQARVERFQIEDERDRRIVTVTVESPSEKLVAQLADLEFVQGVEWGR